MSAPIFLKSTKFPLSSFDDAWPHDDEVNASKILFVLNKRNWIPSVIIKTWLHAFQVLMDMHFPGR